MCTVGRTSWRARSSTGRSVGVTAALLAALAGCAGDLDPSLIPGALGQAGAGGSGATVCDAPKTVFATRCALPACHSATSSSGAGLDFASAGVAARLLGQGPSMNFAAGAACSDAGKPYLVAGSNPAAGLLMDKLDPAKVTCGNAMSLLGQLDATHIACVSAWATAVTTGAITP